MIRRGVQGVKAVPFRLDVGAVSEGKPQAPQNPHRLILQERQWMEAAKTEFPSGKRHIDIAQALGGCLRLDCLQPALERRRDSVPDLIEKLANAGTILFRQ